MSERIWEILNRRPLVETDTRVHPRVKKLLTGEVEALQQQIEGKITKATAIPYEWDWDGNHNSVEVRIKLKGGIAHRIYSTTQMEKDENGNEKLKFLPEEVPESYQNRFRR